MNLTGEPVMLATALAVVLVSVLNAVGVVVDLSVVENLIGAIIAVVAGFAVRQQVTPVNPSV